MKKAFLITLTAVFLLLSGCQPNMQSNVQSHVVTEITVTCESCDGFIRRYYNTAEKMQPILLYIRKIGRTFSVNTDPELVSKTTICIIMTCSDQTQKIYRLKDDCYFQEGSSPWQQYNPEKAGDLWNFILNTPSDPDEQHRTGNPLPVFPPA